MGKHLRWGLFINKGAATILKRDKLFYQLNFQNNYSVENLSVALFEFTIRLVQKFQETPKIHSSRQSIKYLQLY